VNQTSITLVGVIDTFLVLLIGIGPKLALVPFLEVTAASTTPPGAEYNARCWSRRGRWP
jgi:hypothetical protein